MVGEKLVGEEGVEPSRLYSQRILSPSCIPFHHSPSEIKAWVGIAPHFSLRPGWELHPRILVLQTNALATWLPGHKSAGLQTLALPLGYHAIILNYFQSTNF